MDRKSIKNFIIKVRKMLEFLTQFTKGPKVYAVAPATSTLPELLPAKVNDVKIPEKQESERDASSVTDSVAVVELSKKKRRKKAPPKDDSDNANNDSSKEEENMTEHKGHHHHRHKYLCIDSLQVARAHTGFEFTECCCSDDVSVAVQEFYEFCLAKKALYPLLIKKVKLIKSPNDACQLVNVSWLLNVPGAALPQDAVDLIEEIFNKYLEIIDSL